MNIPNRHEGLYCCQRKGVNYLILNSTQLFYTIITMFASYKLGMFLMDTGIGMAFGAMGIGIAIYTWFWVVVDMLDAFAITTSIEMMKNRESVNQVIMHQKFARAKRSFRVF